MDTLDLSSLEKGVVEAALLPSQTTEELVTEGAEHPEVTEEPKVEDTLSQEPEVIQEDVEKAIDNIDIILDESTDDLSTEPKKEGEEEDTENNVYPTLANYLKEKGILEEDTEIKDEKSFVDAINKTIETNKYSNLTERQRTYLEAMEAGIDENSVKDMLSTTSKINSVTEELLKNNPKLATNLITEDLIAQGWDEDKVAKQIERLIKTEELTSEGLTAKASILNREVSKIEGMKTAAVDAKKAREAVEKQQLVELKDAVFGETKALTSITVDDRLRNDVYEAMTKPVAYTKEGQAMNALTKARAEDPIAFEKDLYYAWVITNGFKDLSRQQRRADTSAARKLKAAVQGLSIGMDNQGGGMHTPDADMPDIVDV